MPRQFVMEAIALGNADEDVSEAVVSEVVKLVQQEVQEYLATLQGNGETEQEGHECKLCPFRKFHRRDRLLQHVKKYHCKERMFTANGRSQAQWNILLALFEQEQAGYLGQPMANL